ncbi:MAG: rhodanese-like domain-containing protein [Candidatus Sericytochromatia bacterium]
MSTDVCTSCSVQEFYDVLNNNEGNFIAIDVRTKGEFRGTNISNVKNIPLDEIKKHSQELKKYDKVYISCHNGSRTEEACKKLSKEGVSTIPVDGGIVAWRKAGYPVNSSSDREMISIQRQVQITVGSLIILGFVLSNAINPSFIYISVAMGVGLLFTGISGSCMMASVLGKMPWNK